MRRFKRMIALLVALNLVAWLIGRLLSRRLTRGDERSDEFSVAAVLGGRIFRSRAGHLRSGEVTTTMGGVDLDLRGAELAPDGAELKVRTTMGGTRVLVPETWAIDLRHEEKSGQIDVHVTPPSRLPANAPRLRVDATTRYGGTQITTDPHVKPAPK